MPFRLYTYFTVAASCAIGCTSPGPPKSDRSRVPGDSAALATVPTGFVQAFDSQARAGIAAAGWSLQAPIHRDGPILTAVTTPQESGSNWYYLIHLTTPDGMNQSLEIRNGQPLREGDVRLTDINADGYLDLMVVAGKDHRGGDWFKTWRYDPGSAAFVWLGR